MVRSLLFIVLTSLVLSGLVYSKGNVVKPVPLSPVDHTVIRNDDLKQLQKNFDLLQKRIEELEKKVEKLEKDRQLRIIPAL